VDNHFADIIQFLTTIYYVPDFEWNKILAEAHQGVMGGHYVGKATCRIFCTWICGGLHCINIPKRIVEHAMHVKEWVNHRRGMRCH